MRIFWKKILTDDACLFQDMKTRIAPFTFFYVFPFVVTRLITNVVPLSLVKDGQRQAARPDPTNPVYVDTQLLQLDGSALIQVLYPPQKVRCIYTSTSTICCGGGGRKRGSTHGGAGETAAHQEREIQTESARVSERLEATLPRYSSEHRDAAKPWTAAEAVRRWRIPG